MIAVTATIMAGCTAKLELRTVEDVVGYVRARPQVEKWEIIGAPKEEAAIAEALNWRPA